jgi:hypothetical protein
MNATFTPRTVSRTQITAFVRAAEKTPAITSTPVRAGLLSNLLRALSAFAA